MKNELFESSDSARSNRPLAHAQWLRLEAPFQMERGGAIPDVTLCYETWGELSAEGDNAVLICHALSGDSHVARHDDDDDPGWWDLVVGPGRPIDTDRYFVICSNVLGGCRGSTGPDSRHPETGERYGADFPTVTVGDMVDVQVQLIDHLGIGKLRAVVGGSLGGHQTLAWAARHPERTASLIALATSPRLTAQAIAFDVVGRNAILRDPSYQGGQYSELGRYPAVGLALARMLGHITYLSQEAMTAKFKAGLLPAGEAVSEFERKFSVGSYLAHQGERFVERFDANSYMTLSMAMDLFDLGDSPEALRRSFEQDRCRWLIVSFSSDWLFPPFQSREIVEALIHDHPAVTYCEVKTDCGHDAFLLEDELEIYGELIRGFLGRDAGLAASEPADADDAGPATRVFHRNRIDYDHILRLIDPGDSVLDLACGPGDLLGRLRERGHERLMGVERSEEAIVGCTRRALPVIHGDIDQGLGIFSDGQFDVVVLSQTLQAVEDVESVLREMLRVGRRGIVSFPNVAYEAHRRRLMEEGRVPHASPSPNHRWSDPPRLRLFSMLDFEALCSQLGLRTAQRIALSSEAGSEVDPALDPNLAADLAIYVLEAE
jgi:homoserine O-acetyltransferase